MPDLGRDLTTTHPAHMPGLAHCKGVAQPLSARDLEIAESLGPILLERGLLLAGVDVNGDSVTEINVTSPTCFQEIFDQTGCDVASLFLDALEAAVNS